MKLLPFILIFLSLILPACKAKENAEDILAEVNGEVLELDAFKASIDNGEWEKLSIQQRRQYVEDWVNLTLLAQAADLQKLNEDPAVKQRLDYAQKKVKANALIAQRLAQIDISENQLFSYFRVHQAEFQKPAVMYKVQRIGLPDKLTAENVLKQINQGMDFSTALRRYSIDSLRVNDGMMGFIEFASEDSLFWMAVHVLQANQSTVVNKDNLWYVIRYTESKESDNEASFEEFRAEIRRKILLEKQEEVYRNLLREIKAQNNEIYYY